MTAGGQYCLAWILPAHDAVLLSRLLLPGRLYNIPAINDSPLKWLMLCTSTHIQSWAHDSAVRLLGSMAQEVVPDVHHHTTFAP